LAVIADIRPALPLKFLQAQMQRGVPSKITLDATRQATPFQQFYDISRKPAQALNRAHSDIEVARH
jgi:hypothetical protein